MASVHNILILGASPPPTAPCWHPNSCLRATSVSLVCLPPEANLINAEGFRVRMPVKGRKEMVEIDSRKLPGKVIAGAATDFEPSGFGI